MLTLKIAFRNVWLHKVKTLIIGLIIVFGTTLAIVGNAFVDAIANGMRNSLTHSISGDIQVYSSDAKEKIALFGGMDGGMPDIGHVSDFRRVRDVLSSKVGNIQTVVPMGGNTAMLNPGNLLDIKLEELRGLYKATPREQQRISRLKDHLRAIIEDVAASFDRSKGGREILASEEKVFVDAPANLARVRDPGFWRDFDAQYESRIEFLANNIAPLILDDSMLFLAYIGTLPKLFSESFSQFEIVKGSPIPEGRRGFLFSEQVYETVVKHRIARNLDFVKKKLEKEKLTIASSKELQDKVAATVAQSAEVYTQLEPAHARELIKPLRELLKSSKQEFKELLQDFLRMDDSNFRERYAFFYDRIAPHIILYKVKIGDVFPITVFTKVGYSSSVNMKVYGTYRFKSFEDSPIAGGFNLMDMMSFRELFGFMTPERRAEVKELEKEMGIRDLGKDDLEAMFGKKTEIPVAPEAPKPAKPMLAQAGSPVSGGFAERRKVFDRQYTDQEMENGVFLSAAVILKDASQVAETLERIRKVASEEKLGIQAVDWREASGMVGNITILVRGILYFFVLVIFGVATFVIMNSMLMATLERTREIGTMRAIGAQRKFVLSLMLQETFILSFIFGLIGTFIGVGIVFWLGKVGIPAQGDVATFFFSGDRLYLSVNPLHILAVFVCMTAVAVISTQYPAWRAMQVSPLEAMQKSD